jgi:hypothetical protein
MGSWLTVRFFVDVGGTKGDDSPKKFGNACAFPGVMGSSFGVRTDCISCLRLSYGDEYSANAGSFPAVFGARGVLWACARTGESKVVEVSSRSSACEEVGLGGVAVAPVTVSSTSSSS